MLCFYGLLFAFDTSPRYFKLKNIFLLKQYLIAKKKTLRHQHDRNELVPPRGLEPLIPP